jgi:hypothetical protein
LYSLKQTSSDASVSFPSCFTNSRRIGSFPPLVGSRLPWIAPQVR